MNAEKVYLYHATFLENLGGIRTEGLTPNYDRPSNFDGYPSYERLFVSKTQIGAAFYQDTLAEAFREPTAILRFPADGITLTRDAYGNLDDCYTINSIDPQIIEILDCGIWLPLATTLNDALHLSKDANCEDL